MTSTDFKIIFLPLLALAVSGISLYISIRNAKRQIRVGKVEEMLETILSIANVYSALTAIHALQTKIRNPKISRTCIETMAWESEYSRAVDEFGKLIDVNGFRDKLTRLYVLANCYLPNSNVKRKTLWIVELTANLFQATIINDYDFVKNKFPEFPEDNRFLDFITKIEEQLIKEMNLGYQGIGINKIKESEPKFKKELGIK